MVTAGVLIDAWRAAELTHPNDCCGGEEVATFQVLNEGRHAFVELGKQPANRLVQRDDSATREPDGEKLLPSAEATA